MRTRRLHYFPGNANIAPHILLEELGLDYELVFVDRERGAHREPGYLQLNPAGRIPVYEEGDLVIFETAAICMHLCDTHPHAALAPAVGTPMRAHFYQWLTYLTNTLQAELMTYFYPDRLADTDEAQRQVKQHAERRVNGMLDLLDAELARHGQSWLLGTLYSACDPYLFMLCRWTRNFNRPARSLPHLGPLLARMSARPAVTRAMEAESLAPPWV